MTSRGPWPERPPERPRLEQRIAIEPDGTVVARSGKIEYGQNIRIGFAKIVAEELDVPVERVRVELGETDRVPWDMGTFGSMSTANDGKVLRAAAAQARRLLLARASALLGMPPDTLTTQHGSVQAADGRRVTYESLAAGAPLAGDVPNDVVPRQAAPVADAPLRLEAKDIITGRGRYVADVRLPGMLHGRVLHGPTSGARLASVDDRGTAGLRGVVRVVRDGDLLGVVAERDEEALTAVQTIDAVWHSAETPSGPVVEIPMRQDPGVDAALAASARRLTASYHVPHISHAPIGPSAAVADVRDDVADVFVSTQRPFGLRDEVAAILGLPAERVRVHPRLMSGTYGRANRNDATLEAVRLSRAVGRPVMVTWSRAEEFRLSPQRPTLDAALDAGLDAGGAIAAWRCRLRTNPHAYGDGPTQPRVFEMTAGRNGIPPYRIACAEVTLHVEPAPVRTGPLRSLAAAPNVFAIESFMDELARASSQDPIAFRLRHIDNARLRHVLETARDRSGWTTSTRGGGRGFGAACAVYHGTAVAQVAEVTLPAGGGRPRLERVWCAVDPGRLVHPDGARSQIEGGIQQAASWALLEELQVGEAGQVTSTSWRDYPIATFLDAPRDIDVVFTGDSDAPSTGVGEPGAVPLAAAIANAIVDAGGARGRRLPITQGRT